MTTEEKKPKKKAMLVSMEKDVPSIDVTTKEQKKKFAHLELDKDE